jgi:hypothetical protein
VQFLDQVKGEDEINAEIVSRSDDPEQGDDPQGTPPEKMIVDPACGRAGFQLRDGEGENEDTENRNSAEDVEYLPPVEKIQKKEGNERDGEDADGSG